MFWDCWRREYLPTLLKRNKNTQKVEPLRVGDIVLITDDDVPQGKGTKRPPPGKWLKGRIIIASDGQLRQAVIKTVKGILKRPAVKIAVLDIVKENDANNFVNNSVPEEPNDISEHSLHIAEERSKITPKRRNVNLNFTNWGKKSKKEEEKVKQLTEKLKPKTVPNKKRGRILPYSGTVAATIITAASILWVMLSKSNQLTKVG